MNAGKSSAARGTCRPTATPHLRNSPGTTCSRSRVSGFSTMSRLSGNRAQNSRCVRSMNARDAGGLGKSGLHRLHGGLIFVLGRSRFADLIHGRDWLVRTVVAEIGRFEVSLSRQCAVVLHSGCRLREKMQRRVQQGQPSFDERGAASARTATSAGLGSSKVAICADGKCPR